MFVCSASGSNESRLRNGGYCWLWQAGGLVCADEKGNANDGEVTTGFNCNNGIQTFTRDEFHKDYFHFEK